MGAVRDTDGTLGALGRGTDAVLLARSDTAGALSVEVVNDAARDLFGIDAPGARLVDERVPLEVRPLLLRIRDAMGRPRATREQIALAAPSGARVVVDVQLEPVAPVADGEPGVLVVVRQADAPTDAEPAPPAVGVFRTELGLGAVFMDDALLALLGLSHEQALGHGWLEAVHLDDRQRVADALERRDTREEVVDLECRVVRGGVEERSARIRAVPVRGDDGALTGYLGSLEDLTGERRQAEAVARLAELADVVDEWIIIADPDLRLRFANPAATRGLALPELTQHEVNVADLASPERIAEIEPEITAALDATGTWTGDVYIAALDGRPIELQGTIVAHRTADGSIAHYSLLGRDLSSLREVQRELDETQTRFRMIADSSPTGMYFIERGVVQYANPRFAEILGETTLSVVGRSFVEWVHPDDVNGLVDAGALVAAQGREMTAECRIQRANGEVRWIRARGAPMLLADGTTRGYVGALVDITDERTASRGLAMLGRAIESTPDFITFHDSEGRMFFANASARAFFGIGAHDPVPPLGPDEYLDVPQSSRESLDEALHSEGQWTGELVAVNPAGDRIPVDVVVVGHRDENGDIEYYSARSHDLTERRSADAARRRSETVLRAIVQSSPLAIFALDRHGVVHVWNHAAEELFQWSADEVVGTPPPFLNDETRDEIDGLVARVFRGRTVKGYLGRYVRRDGQTIDVDLSIAPLRNPEGRVVTAVAVLADVSEQVRATRAVRESEVWFRSLVQHSSDMVAVIAPDGTISYASPRTADFVGLEVDRLIGRSAGEMFTFLDDDRDLMSSSFARLRSIPGSSERIVFRSPRHDGVLRWIEMTVSNLLENPAVSGIVVNARDITEQYEADTAVRASEERLRTLVSSVSDAIVVLAADGAVLYSSPVADAMFEKTPAGESEGLFAAIDPADLPRSVELWEETVSNAGVRPAAEVRLHQEDGSVVDAEVIANNLLDEPSINGIVMTIRDVTARRQSEQRLRESEGRLRESEARYRAVVDDQVELVCRYLPDSTLTFVNRAFADFYGRTREELVGSQLVDLYPVAERQLALDRLGGFGPGNELQTYDEWELGIDGVRRCYRWIDRAFIDADGRVSEVQSVGHDVTEERRASVLTANQTAILEQVARGVPLDETLEAIASTVEQYFSRLSCAVFLLDSGGETLRLAASPTLAREAVVDGDIEPAWSTPILAADGRTTLGSVAVYDRDFTTPDAEHRRIFSLVAHLASIAVERKAFEDQLAHQSMHDPLTGLPNRVLFIDRLSVSIARGRRTQARVAVLFLDLDRFKNVNDSQGHDAGDELLVAVARRLESVLRPGDTVARFGGDEFTILCEDLADDPAHTRASEIANRLLEAMSHPFVVRAGETYVGVSIGIALANSGEETADELLRDADAAMYHAKEAGRGCVAVFDETIRERALTRHATENALHRAIERGELRLFFQPIVNLADARCIGAEALVRWQHPERGLVPPAEFVSLAEETGLIVPLGAWVLEHAARQAARWQMEHDTFSVSINLSARQLAQPDLTTQVADVIERNGVKPQNLTFEITESVLMEDADAVIRVIEQLRAIGVRFAIDDFGTGYSSLGYLKQFAVDTVKIDRAFVDGLGSDPGDHAIVSAVVGLAHALGLTVVAEGVETEAQLVELVALGCDEAQGYFFAPPQPAQDLRALVSSTRRWRPPGTPLMGRP